jgi:hypothetical protein
MMVVRRQEERRAKVTGTHVIADGKFQTSGISGIFSSSILGFPESPEIGKGGIKKTTELAAVRFPSRSAKSQ